MNMDRLAPRKRATAIRCTFSSSACWTFLLGISMEVAAQAVAGSRHCLPSEPAVTAPRPADTRVVSVDELFRALVFPHPGLVHMRTVDSVELCCGEVGPGRLSRRRDSSARTPR